MINNQFQDMTIDTSKKSFINISIEGIKNLEEFQLSKEKLAQFISISNLEIQSFKNNIITYKVDLMGDKKTLIANIKSSSFFEILNDKDKDKLSLIFIK